MCANEAPVTMGQTHIIRLPLLPPMLTNSPGFYSISGHNQICPTGQAAVSFARG